MYTIKNILKSHKDFFEKGITKNIYYRLNSLLRLEKAIKKYEKEILIALKKDLDRAPFESYETEVGFIYKELRIAIKNISKWSKLQKVGTPLINFMSSSYIYNEPYGTVLIMSPWNYPFLLTINPLIGAISAGNCCVLKVSENSINSSRVIEKIVREVFDKEHVSLIQGGKEVNQQLLNEKFDYIFFTGSPSVGKIVMKSASKYLTPLTLELGGKSPCIVDKSANISVAAKRIAWGKFLNAGQVCISPDYVLVHESKKFELVKLIQKNIIKFYGKIPEKSQDYPRIINEKHFKRLTNLMNHGRIIYGGRASLNTLKIAPTIIDSVKLDSPIMQEEIFGPLLPIITFKEINQAYSIVGSFPKPLALYIFSNDKYVIRETLNKLSFGGGCINDTITHIANSNLPFGGVGQSGMGKYHGKLSFDTFTNKKGVVKKSNLIDIYLRYPPYKNHLSIIKKLM